MNSASRTLALVFAVLAAGCSATLAPAPPHAFVAPPPSTAAGVHVCWVEFARNTMPGSYGISGDSDHLHWDITVSGLLIRHPKGDVLVDAGNSSHFDRELDGSGFFAKVLLRAGPGSNTVVATAPDALRVEVHESPAALKAIVLSHAHPDHAGGLVDLAGVPVLASAEEIAFVREQKDKGGSQVVRAHAEAILARARPIVFRPVPYATFDASSDLYGDGAVVFVPLAGHTPGAIGTFVSAPGLRLFHVGDTTNTMEAIEKRRGKALPLEWTDFDESATERTVARLSQLHTDDPALVMLPAHDRRQWVKLFGAPGGCR
jgi:glyoxylase-like metal-dependent hydrolase (beta-lactamase superfamily II)